MTGLRLLAFGFALLSTVALIAPAQAASGNAVAAQHQWSAMDKCTRDAIVKFPDQTAEGLAQRDSYIRKCQQASRLPVRQGLAPKE